ncbi:hypothetical protein BGX28_001133 [Mortierella sp. GBA30]|nr:hypothetical protein BGX28_001133 [Mortierella sp. GBA30]
MADIAALNSSMLVKDPRSSVTGAQKSILSAGSKDVMIDYEAEVRESSRCLYCISSPCKATLEIKLKLYQIRVSLDWILSGMALGMNLNPIESGTIESSNARGPGQLPA